MPAVSAHHAARPLLAEKLAGRAGVAHSGKLALGDSKFHFQCEEVLLIGLPPFDLYLETHFLYLKG